MLEAIEFMEDRFKREKNYNLIEFTNNTIILCCNYKLKEVEKHGMMGRTLYIRRYVMVDTAAMTANGFMFMVIIMTRRRIIVLVNINCI